MGNMQILLTSTCNPMSNVLNKHSRCALQVKREMEYSKEKSELHLAKVCERLENERSVDDTL